jgi:hypothetical protein
MAFKLIDAAQERWRAVNAKPTADQRVCSGDGAAQTSPSCLSRARMS